MESGDDDFPEKKREIIRNVSSLASFPAVRYWWNKAREHCQNSCKVETKTYFHYFLIARGYLECESVGPGFESRPQVSISPEKRKETFPYSEYFAAVFPSSSSSILFLTEPRVCVSNPSSHREKHIWLWLQRWKVWTLRYTFEAQASPNVLLPCRPQRFTQMNKRSAIQQPSPQKYFWLGKRKKWPLAHPFSGPEKSLRYTQGQIKIYGSP